jgi:CBS domain-containing membrane protein
VTEQPTRFGLQRWLQERLGTSGEAIYAAGAGAVAIAISGLAAHLLRQPLLFPSLGPTVFLFFETPLTPQASPRNTLIGHGVALLAGYVSLAIFGLLAAPSVLESGVTVPYIGAAALSILITMALLVLLSSPHPPAGATTLIVSLGFLTTLAQLAAMAAGVILLTVVGWLMNRLLGVPVPLWSAEARPEHA